MKIIKKIYPSMQILCFWTHSYLLLHPTHNGFIVPPEKNSYGLLPSFIDGLIEEAGDETEIHDISEFAYSVKEREKFLEIYNSILNKSRYFSSIPDIFRKKIKVGFGISLDVHAHGRPELWNTREPSKNYFTPEDFKKALKEAIEITDEYVWIYTQYPKFFPKENLPDEYIEVMRKVRKEMGLQE